MRHQTPHRVLFSMFLLLAPATHAVAQGVPILNDGLSRCAIIQALRGHMPPDCTASVTKEIVFTAPPPARAGVPPAFATTLIQFAFDSATLTPDSRRPLDTVAEALKDPYMANQVIRVEGHTDNIGTALYNQRLSAQRARSVQQYLHTQHGIPLARLPAVGKGFSAPYIPQNPSAALNRRVQFVNLSE